ncbi:LPXTG cell wall anchor domain-containing protein [Streptococcus hyointestinalis]|uniref:Extracellular protein n=1 Tax=Streptococcus hyointestinalis TaxID=1337 RepID=A0A380KDD1_9STRE|nr:LPXTG cell wall anchor domain-containing protein [Streptococcus hyointestinalis]SUN63053.1 Extracellular protein [Streptococcus hyointestinalis]
MKKVKLVTLLSSALLASSAAGVFADDLVSDGTSLPSTEQTQPSTSPSTSTSEGTSLPSDSSGSPTVPSTGTEVTPPSSSEGTSDIPTTPTESESSSSSSTNEEHSETTTQPNLDDQNKDNAGEQVDPNTGNTTVPTTDGGSAQVTPNKTVPTNNPSVSADTATKAGASQVGTTSTITGQVVQNVTAQAPVVTNTGATIVSTKDGQLVLSDGSTVTPETVGATTNSDKTITVTKADGTKATLPETGDKARSLLSVLGAGLLVTAGFLAQKAWSRKEEKN